MSPGEIIPAYELLADMYLYSINKLALETYEKNLKSRPYRFNGIYGAAKAAEKLNNVKLANYYFNQLIDLTKGINSSRPEIKEANEYILKNSTMLADNV